MAIVVILIAAISRPSLANVSLSCFDPVKPCAHIGISEGGGHAVVTFTGCTATPGQFQFTNGQLRNDGGFTNDTWRQFVEDGQNGLYFGETIVHSGTGVTKGAERAFRVNPGMHTGSMIIRGSIGTQSSLSIVCR
jgi:hypothetical protein